MVNILNQKVELNFFPNFESFSTLAMTQSHKAIGQFSDNW